MFLGHLKEIYAHTYVSWEGDKYRQVLHNWSFSFRTHLLIDGKGLLRREIFLCNQFKQVLCLVQRELQFTKNSDDLYIAFKVLLFKKKKKVLLFKKEFIHYSKWKPICNDCEASVYVNNIAYNMQWFFAFRALINFHSLKFQIQSNRHQTACSKWDAIFSLC